MQSQPSHKLIATPLGIFLDDEPLHKSAINTLSARSISHLTRANALLAKMTAKDWEPPAPHGPDDTPLRAHVEMHLALANAGSLNKYCPGQPRNEMGRWTCEDVTDESKLDINWSFISKLEGGQRTKGYVPDVNKSKSGVTIATGVDLGARSALDIDKLDISDDLKAKLKPYCGKQGKDATDFLKKNPLTITESEATELDKAIRQQTLDSLVPGYNKAVDEANEKDQGARVHFEKLPQSIQTVIASVKFQYGSLPSSCPNFWEQITEQRWKDASDNLKDFEDDYPVRRNREAALMDRAINAASGNP